MLQGYVVRERKLLVWHQLCSTTKSSSPISMWQHTVWNSARCVKRCVIHKEALSGFDMRMVEDKKHLLLVYPNTQKVRKRFCSTLTLTHNSTLVELMQTTNMVALTKFVACCEYQRTDSWSTFRLMNSLVPNGHKIVNSKQFQQGFSLKFLFVLYTDPQSAAQKQPCRCRICRPLYTPDRSSIWAPNAATRNLTQ